MATYKPGVNSVKKTGSAALKGDVTLTEGANVTITQSGQDITIASAGSGGGAVSSVNTQTGAVVLDQDDVADGTTYKQYSATEKTKLTNIATAATANDTDANLKARANHTGTQTASTISDFSTAADARITAANKKTDSMTTNKLLGRGTAGTGAIEEITLGTGLSLTGTTLNAAGGGGSGDMLASTYDPAGVAQQVVGTTASQTLTNKTLTTPSIAQVNDTNGNAALLLPATASAVNQITISNAPTGSAPVILSSGSDAFTGLYFNIMGTSGSYVFQVNGTNRFVINNTVVKYNGVNIPTISSTDTLTNKDLTSGTNTFPTSLATLTGTQTLANKTLTAPILSGTVTGTYTLGGTPTFPATVVNTTGTQTLTNKDLSSSTNVFPSGTVVQVVSANFSTQATGTGTIPVDNTIPQISEGTEFMTLAITPKSATNVLIISVTAEYSSTVSGGNIIQALFQDATANALAANMVYEPVAGAPVPNSLMYRMAAGTTSSTTFRVRAGTNAAGTTTFLNALFGAVGRANMTITEVKA